jgi:hypothetical protein
LKKQDAVHKMRQCLNAFKLSQTSSQQGIVILTSHGSFSHTINGQAQSGTLEASTLITSFVKSVEIFKNKYLFQSVFFFFL